MPAGRPPESATSFGQCYGQASRRCHAAGSIFGVLLLVLLAACSNPYDRHEQMVRAFAANDNLSIQDISLDYSGRRLAFTFSEGRDGHALIERIALADLDKGIAWIPDLGARRYGWHSPSFDRQGERLVLISSCVWTGCPPEHKGSHIAVNSLTSGRLDYLTRGERTLVWDLASGKDCVRLANRKLYRDTPIFSPSGDRIYYLASANALTSWSRGNARHGSIRVLELSSGVDRGLLDDRSDAVYFPFESALASYGEDRVVVFGGPGACGTREQEFEQSRAFGYLIGPSEGRLEVLFDGSDYPGKRQPNIAILLTTLTASLDGRRLAYVLRQSTRSGRAVRSIVLWEDGAKRTVATARDFEWWSIGDLAMSGDGRRLAVIGRSMTYSGDQRTFWMVDLETGQRREYPLTPLLRQALDSTGQAG